MNAIVLLATAVVLTLAAAAGGAEPPPRLPPLSFEDQEGHTLDLAGLRGRVVVIVYGTRDGLEHHTEWGRRLHEALVAQGMYRADDAVEHRPVRILALAQMGGIPTAFRSLIRTALRARVPAGFALYLDWDDRMSDVFGPQRKLSTVVVSDRDGGVRQVTVGLPRDDKVHSVRGMIRRLA